MCGTLYFNPFANFNKLYAPYGKKMEEKLFRLNTFILTKIKLQSINDVSLPGKSSNKFRGDSIRLGAFYVCDVTHDEILETIFSRE